MAHFSKKTRPGGARCVKASDKLDSTLWSRVKMIRFHRGNFRLRPSLSRKVRSSWAIRGLVARRLRFGLVLDNEGLSRKFPRWNLIMLTLDHNVLSSLSLAFTHRAPPGRVFSVISVAEKSIFWANHLSEQSENLHVRVTRSIQQLRFCKIFLREIWIFSIYQPPIKSAWRRSRRPSKPC